MAKDLKLKSEWVDSETVKVSWMDIKIREQTGGNQFGLVVLFLGGFVFAFVIMASGGGLWGLGLYIVAVIWFVIWSGSKVHEPNSITIGKSITTHRKASFNTAEITRFEMGNETALTGGRVTKPLIGESVDQTIIRLWIGDSSAYDITRNNWQIQVNHEIRDALSKALEAVRDLDRQEKHAEEFGKVDESGMPEY